MKLYYITLNNENKAKAIGLALLQKRHAACVNWWPIHSAYYWENELKTEQEIVLVVKTKENMRGAIEAVVAEHIDYTTFIAEIDVASVNSDFLQWLNGHL